MLMQNLTFYLRHSRVQKDGKMPIYVRIRLGKEKIEQTIGYTINPKNWNSINECVLKCQEADLINSVIRS